MEDDARMKHEARDVARAEAAQQASIAALKQGSKQELQPVEDDARMKHEARDVARAEAAQRASIAVLKARNNLDLKPSLFVKDFKHVVRNSARFKSAQHFALNHLRSAGPVLTEAERIVNKIKTNALNIARIKKVHNARIQSLEETMMKKEVSSLTLRRKKLDDLLKHVVEDFISHHFPVSIAHYIRRKVLNSVQIERLVAMAREDDNMLSKLKSTLSSELYELSLAQNRSFMNRAKKSLNTSMPMIGQDDNVEKNGTELVFNDSLSALIRKTFLEFNDLFRSSRTTKGITIGPKYISEKANVGRHKKNRLNFHPDSKSRSPKSNFDQVSTEKHRNSNQEIKIIKHLVAHASASIPPITKNAMVEETESDQNIHISDPFSTAVTSSAEIQTRSSQVLHLSSPIAKGSIVATVYEPHKPEAPLDSQQVLPVITADKSSPPVVSKTIVSDQNRAVSFEKTNNLGKAFSEEDTKSLKNVQKRPMAEARSEELVNKGAGSAELVHLQPEIMVNQIRNEVRTQNNIKMKESARYFTVEAAGPASWQALRLVRKIKAKVKKEDEVRRKRREKLRSAMFGPENSREALKVKSPTDEKDVRGSSYLSGHSDHKERSETSRFHQSHRFAGQNLLPTEQLSIKHKFDQVDENEEAHQNDNELSHHYVGSGKSFQSSTKNNFIAPSKDFEFKYHQKFIDQNQNKISQTATDSVLERNSLPDNRAQGGQIKILQSEQMTRAISARSKHAHNQDMVHMDVAKDFGGETESDHRQRLKAAIKVFRHKRRGFLLNDGKHVANSKKFRFQPQTENNHIGSSESVPKVTIDLPGNKKFLEKVEEEEEEHQRQYVVEAERESLHFSKRLANFLKDRKQKSLLAKLSRARRTVANLEDELDLQNA